MRRIGMGLGVSRNEEGGGAGMGFGFIRKEEGGIKNEGVCIWVGGAALYICLG